MPQRDTNGYITFLHQFTEIVLVICPSCNSKATVFGYVFPAPSTDVKITCTTCGFNKTLPRSPGVFVKGIPKKSIAGKHLIYGAPIDPFFHLPLYLTDTVRGNLFWAYNTAHLQFLREFISADLRERNGKKVTNGSIGSRLPKWMTLRQNRSEVLKTIDKLFALTQ